MEISDHMQKKRSHRALKIVGWTIGGICLAVIVAIVFGFLVQFIWAQALTPIFGFKEITYWQAVGIVILAKLIFGGHHAGHKHDEIPVGGHIHDSIHRKTFREKPETAQAGRPLKNFSTGKQHRNRRKRITNEPAANTSEKEAYL